MKIIHLPEKYNIEWKMSFSTEFNKPYVYGSGHMNGTRVLFTWQGKLFAEPVTPTIDWELKTPIEVERYLDNIEQIIMWAHGIRAYRG